MRVDGGLGSGSGREPEELRTILQAMEGAGATAARSRTTFVGPSGGGEVAERRLLWLAVAASLALLLVYQVKRPGRPAPPVVAERPALRTPPPPPRVEATRREARATPTLRPERRGHAAAPPAEGAVIVEPRQAELLAQLARQLQGARQAPPGVSAAADRGGGRGRPAPSDPGDAEAGHRAPVPRSLGEGRRRVAVRASVAIETVEAESHEEDSRDVRVDGGRPARDRHRHRGTAGEGHEAGRRRGDRGASPAGSVPRDAASRGQDDDRPDRAPDASHRRQAGEASSSEPRSPSARATRGHLRSPSRTWASRRR